jgi:hypothetical protein
MWWVEVPTREIFIRGKEEKKKKRREWIPTAHTY